jgi:hypothetical protein
MKYLALTYVFPTALIIGLLGIFKKGIYQKHIFRNGWFLFIINSFNPESIVSDGNNKLKSGMFDINIEDSDLALGYKTSGAATAPKPGRFV